MFKERVNRIFSFFSAVSLLVNTFVAPISLYMQTAPTALAVKPEVVTFCHVAGQADDPANYVDLTLPWNAVYGQAGHFNENGTTQAGHEQDYLGPCNPPTVTPSPEETPTATPTEEPTATPTDVPDNITICHAAGLVEDPANYVTLELPWPAVYGPGGHFNENGTTQAGHEEDYFGTCITPTPTPTEELTPTPTEEPTATPTEIPIETPTPAEEPTPTPPNCNLEYSCFDCSTLDFDDPCLHEKRTYCQRNYDCGFDQGEQMMSGITCPPPVWSCTCPIPTETPTPTPTDELTPTPTEIPTPTPTEEPVGVIKGFKWHDENGNGERDCEVNLTDGLNGMNSDDLCEPRLAGWTIFIDENGNQTLDEGEKSTTTSDNPNHYGAYRFKPLTPGIYSVCEVQQEGWTQTYPDGCHTVNVLMDFSSEESENYDRKPLYNFGNTETEEEILSLEIEKSNNAPDTASAGITVTYTLTVTNTGNADLNVAIKDVLPGGFHYVSGSSKLDGTVVPDPTVVDGSLNWHVGSLSTEEDKTLTYDVTTDSDLKDGTYTNVAIAHGERDGESVESDPATSEVNIGLHVDISTSVGGEVLGASTEILPATGSETNLSLALFIMLLLGLALKFMSLEDQKDAILTSIKKYAKSVVTTLAALILTFVSLRGAYAYADKVVIQRLPEYITTDSFEISYSGLSANPVIARFFVRKDGDGTWRRVNGDINGSSGQVQVGGGDVYSGEAKYFFKVEINGGTATDETSTTIDRSGPDPVSGYWKEKVAGGFYRLHWKNPGNDDFSRVFIYRSTETKFTADGTTKVGEVGGATEADMTWDNVGLDSNKNYYYAVRAIDEAGNGSGIVADPETVSITSNAASTQNEGEVTSLPEEDAETLEATDEGSVLGENGDDITPTPTPASIVNKIKQFAKDRTKITLGIVGGLLVIGYYIVNRFRVANPEPPVKKQRTQKSSKSKK
ncbi:hypothetical protein A3A76_01735 [Candidatus Woesebacteria bacterium RIFCSPLOWO2_01_FULL_39_23]|uniref:DUF11 domain-containing protein n=1 Tax=Candidatus Woesebacteria bacterium RIFCSPHIGHO2_01_FULL_40_22 TaxID=1802499 RepID=A0A1F7YEP9_9BACT|nr:MAG: hypothetical protein A2141_02310 [Candidatus Woesebacteria bacterium RBG_16_40_11]OGM25801.1 MAG: hypothetical protein A2628_00590 [Candidatus Woesebacteria bacterium RIFCSPHIGHO2_01_FULL_40_22]OGM61754.1 MAG: hypothetical protein A3A76_01735 [Candidatus Woesebacteria bacterium RIFCSPLOWO2_01_FULL_39_23]